MGGALKLKGDTPWLIDKKKKKKKKREKELATNEAGEEEQPVILGTDGKPIDPKAISVMSKNTYDEEFAHEMEKLKKGGETKSVPWGSTVRAPPEILHGYTKVITGKTASERLDLRSASRSDKFCK